METDYDKVHAKRFDLSYEWVKPHLTADTKVLDLGGGSIFRNRLAPASVSGTDASDLRKAIPVRSSSVDLVLCMEVLEHIGDRDGMHTEWAGDGVKMLMTESRRVLKEGGVFFLTTPNAASITAIHHALRLAPPMIWRPHVREYAPYELDEVVRQAGFEIIRRETFDVWRNAISETAHSALSQFIYHQGYPTTLRGEDIFLLARKPVFKNSETGPQIAEPKEKQAKTGE